MSNKNRKRHNSQRMNTNDSLQRPMACRHEIHSVVDALASETVTVPLYLYNEYITAHIRMKMVYSMLSLKKFCEDELRTMFNIELADDKA